MTLYQTNDLKIRIKIKITNFIHVKFLFDYFVTPKLHKEKFQKVLPICLNQKILNLKTLHF